MTSTNDGKDVKSNQTSGRKGKTYYIELYKSLEARLSGECSGEDRTRLVCEAWRRVYSLCQHSAPSTHLHFLSWLQRHTSHTILQTEWQSPKSKDQHTWLNDAIEAFVSECQEAISKRNGVGFSWENHLFNRATWFQGVLSNPWGHPVLKSLLDSRGPQPDDEEVLEWLKEERGVMFVTRLRQLAASKCDDLALLLAAAVMDRVRSATAVVSDAQQAEEPKDKPEGLGLETSFPNILQKQAGFTVDLWELITDIEFVLLYKGQSRTRCIELAKQTPLRNGYQLVERLHKRLENSPQEKKLWKNAKDVAALIAQVVIARCMVVPSCAGVARAALYGCVYSLVLLLPADKLRTAAAALAAPAATSRHLHTLAVSVHAQCKEERKPFVCSLYVRAITAGMNELENLKLNTKKESQARSTEQTLASWFIQLGALLSASSRLSCECILTAFSVHPSPAMYERVKRAPPLAPLVKSELEQQEPTSPEFGSWATDSRTQTNLVKTSETLNLKQTQKQANVLSTAIFTEGEALGLEAELCQDLAVLLSGPRVKTLYWDLDKEVLLENCQTYMEKTHGGTRAVTTELKYLNLDPTSFQHLPEEEEDENDIYYGIEKGYEHLVEFEEPLRDILSDDSISTDTATSLVELPIAIPKRKRNKSKHLQFVSEAIDPLSITPDIIKEDKKESTHSKDRSKHKSKDRDKNGSKIKVGGSGMKIENSNELIEDKCKEIERKEKKKERKERKKKDKLQLSNEIKMENLQSCNLSRLVGTKIIMPNAIDKLESQHNTNFNADKNVCTDSDYDSQGKSSITSVNSDLNDHVLFDSLNTMDIIKSSLTDLKQRTDTPPVVYSHQNVNCVKEDVKKGIQKLIDYRRHKVPNEKSKYPEASTDHSHSSKHFPNILHSSVITPSSVIVTETSKTSSNMQVKKYTAIENESNIYIGSNKKNQIIGEKYSGIVIKDREAQLNDNAIKVDLDNTHMLSKHSLSYMKQGGKTVMFGKTACPEVLIQRKGNMQTQIKSRELVDKQSLKQLGPSSSNLCKSPSQNIPQDLSGKQTTNVTPSQKQFHNFLKELQETINAGAINDKFITDKTLCSKKIIQPKKTDNALNTFSRLSYMHKNKQFDHKSKFTTSPIVTQNKSMQNVTVDQIQHLKGIDEKVSHLQAKGEIVISRVDKTKTNRSNENSKVLVQKIENVYGSAVSINSQMSINHNKKYPVISNMLSSDKRTSDFTIPNKNGSNGNKPSNIPTPQHSTTFLSEKDQFDLLLLLRQQSKMNPPMAPVKLQFPKKSPSGIDISDGKPQHPKSEKPGVCHGSNTSKLFEEFSSQSYPTSVIKTTNKSINNLSEPKEKGYSKESGKKSISKQKTKNNDAQQSDWKSVMDDLLAQKTPSRGPNALDVVLKKDSFEKRSSNSLNIQNQGTAITSKHAKRASNSNNIPIQLTGASDTPTSSGILEISKSSLLPSDLKQKQEKSMNKNSCSDTIKNNPAHVHEKHFPSVIQNSNDPFISGIPNSDYDLLEELMDDDLRQEIGELSSDEETYRRTFLGNSKTKTNILTKELELLFNNQNAVAAGNSNNNDGTNYSTITKNLSIKNPTKTAIEKTNSNDTNKPHTLCKESFTKPVCVKSSVVCEKACTIVSETPQKRNTSDDVKIYTETTCHHKNNPISITTKPNKSNNNKILANASNNNLSKKVENPQMHTSDNNFHETNRGPIIFDPTQVLLAIPQRGTSSNVMIIDSDLICDPFSTLQANSSNMSGNSSESNQSAYVAMKQAPINLTVLHTTPLATPVPTLVTFDSSPIPIIQRLPSKDFKNDTNKLNCEDTKQIALNEELQELSQSNIDTTNALDLNISTSTSITSDNSLLCDPLLSNFIHSDIKTNALHQNTKSVKLRLRESTKNLGLDRKAKRKVSVKLKNEQGLTISDRSNTNEPVNKTTCFLKNDCDIENHESIPKKRLLHLNRYVRNLFNESQSTSKAIPHDVTMQSEQVHKKQESIENVHEIQNNYEITTRQNIKIKPNNNQSIQLDDRKQNIELVKANNDDKNNKQIMEDNNYFIQDNNNIPSACLNSINVAEYETDVNNTCEYVKQITEVKKTDENVVNDSNHVGKITSKFSLKAVNNEIFKDKDKYINNVEDDMVYKKQDHKYSGTKHEKLKVYSDKDRLSKDTVSNVNFEEKLTDVRKEIHQDEIKCTPQQFISNPKAEIPLETEVNTHNVGIKKSKTSNTKINAEKTIWKYMDNKEVLPHNTDIGKQIIPIIPESTTKDLNLFCANNIIGVFGKNDTVDLHKEPSLISNCMITAKDCDVPNEFIVEHSSDVAQSESQTESVLETSQYTGPQVNTGVTEEPVRTKNINDDQSAKIRDSSEISKNICTAKNSLNTNNKSRNLNNIDLLEKNIVFEELPDSINGPLKRCVRIKLPNGTIFKATISGKLNVNINSIFEDPFIKSLLLENINNNTKCTLNINQHCIQKAKGAPVLKTEVKNITYVKQVISSPETINLISDDEDSDPQSFKTEFGNFIISTMDENVHKKHQKKLSLKSMVLLERCNVLQSLVQAHNKSNEQPERNNICKENQSSSAKTTIIDYIEIDDSSNDCADAVNPFEANSYCNINTNFCSEKDSDLKNLLLQDLGVEQNIGDNKTEFLNIMSEINENKEVLPLIPKNGNKLKTCLLKLEKCDELVEKLRIRKQKCFVSLIRCDQAIKDSEKKDLDLKNKMCNELIEQDETAKTTLKRSDSESILNKLILDNPNDWSQSIEEIPVCVSPSLICNFEIPTNFNVPKDVNTAIFMTNFTSIQCDADWFMTKTFLHKCCSIIHQLPFPTSNSFKEKIKYDDSSTDCDSDLDTSLSTNNDVVENEMEVPSLLKLIMNFFASRSDIIDRIIKTGLPCKNITQCSGLKRKSTDAVDLRQCKISKTIDYFKFDTTIGNSICTNVINQKLDDKNASESVFESNSLSNNISETNKFEDMVTDCDMSETKDHVLYANCNQYAVSYDKLDLTTTSVQNTSLSEATGKLDILNFEKILSPLDLEYGSTIMCSEMNTPSNALENVASNAFENIASKALENVIKVESQTPIKSTVSEMSVSEFSNRRTEEDTNAICNLEKSEETNGKVTEHIYSIKTENNKDSIASEFNLVTGLEMHKENISIMGDLNEREEKAHFNENNSKCFFTLDTEEEMDSKFVLNRRPQNNLKTCRLEELGKINTLISVDEQNMNFCAVSKETALKGENYPKKDVHTTKLIESELMMHNESKKKGECLDEILEKLSVASLSTTMNIPVDMITENTVNFLEIKDPRQVLVHGIETQEEKKYSPINVSCSETFENIPFLKPKLDTQLKTQIENTFKICREFTCLPEVEVEKRLFLNGDNYDETKTCAPLSHTSLLQKTVLNFHSDIVPFDRPDIDEDIVMKKTFKHDVNTSNNIMETRYDIKAGLDAHDENSTLANSMHADTESIKEKSALNKKCTVKTIPIKKSDNVEGNNEKNSILDSNDANNKLHITGNLQIDVQAVKLSHQQNYYIHEEIDNANIGKLSISADKSRSNSIMDNTLSNDQNIPIKENLLPSVVQIEAEHSAINENGMFKLKRCDFGNGDKDGKLKTIIAKETSRELQPKLNFQVDSQQNNEIYDPFKELKNNIKTNEEPVICVKNVTKPSSDLKLLKSSSPGVDSFLTCQIYKKKSLNVPDNGFNINTYKEEQIATMTPARNNTEILESAELGKRRFDLKENSKSFECQHNVNYYLNESEEMLKKTSKMKENNTCALCQKKKRKSPVPSNVLGNTVIVEKNNYNEVISESLNENHLRPIVLNMLPKLDETDNKVNAEMKLNHSPAMTDNSNLKQTENTLSNCSGILTFQTKEKDGVLEVTEKQKTSIELNGNTLKPRAILTENVQSAYTKYDLHVDVEIEGMLFCGDKNKNLDNICTDSDNNFTSKCDVSAKKSDCIADIDRLFIHNNQKVPPKYVMNVGIEDCLSSNKKTADEAYENKQSPSFNVHEDINNIVLSGTTVTDSSGTYNNIERKCNTTDISVLPEKLLASNKIVKQKHEISSKFNYQFEYSYGNDNSGNTEKPLKKCTYDNNISGTDLSSNITSTNLQILNTKVNNNQNNLVINQSKPVDDDCTAQNINIKSNNNKTRDTNDQLKNTVSGNTNPNLISSISYSNVRCQLNCDATTNIVRRAINKKSVLDDLTEELRNKDIFEKTDVCTSDKFQKNVTLVYKGDSSVILKGSIYEDPVVGTCYVFPIENSASMIQEVNCNNICENKSVIESLKSKVLDDCRGRSLEDYQDVGHFKVVPPKITYARQRLKNDGDIIKPNNNKWRNNLKRKLINYETKLSAKRYRKGKNIDCPKLAVTTMLNSAYSKEYKRLLDYCSSIKFSFSRPFHKEYIDVPAVLKYWPIKELHAKVLTDTSNYENVLFSEDHKNTVPFDPLQQTLAEEISSKHNECHYASYHINENNFHMGFGEESDRVITTSDRNNISKVSAATLSDVKQSQPFLTSEDNGNYAYGHKLWMPNKNQIEILKRSISYIQLRDKVRSFFKKTTAELNCNWVMNNVKYKNSFNNKHVKNLFPYDLLSSEFIEPAPIEAVLQVVQVGQLPVSAAAQNPVTCDPRVTQVTDASPQCSLESSSHDDSQSPIKTEYTELTTADLSLPLVQEYERHIMEAQESSKMTNSHHEDIPVETEITSIVKTEITVELSPMKEEPIDYDNESDDLQSLVNKHINNVEYTYDSNDNTILETPSSTKITYDSLEKENNDYSVHQEEQNGIAEKNDQIAHAMNAAGITTIPETLINSREHDLVNVVSQKICRDVPTTTSTPNNHSKTPINAMTLQQALAQILPPPLNKTNIHENNQKNANSSVSSQVLHIVQEKNTNDNQITLVDNTQNSVISNNTTPVLHIVQSKGSNTSSLSSNSGQDTNSYSSLSLVDTGIQQGNNQLLHIVNTNNQKNNATGQIFKRVNLLTNLTNVQGSNEQKMVQFVCKSTDGKSIHLNAPPQRSMVLRLQPIESPNIHTTTTTKGTECQDSSNSSSNTNIPSKESTTLQHEIKSRSVYEENYAKFIQSSNNITHKTHEKSTSLPKFNQVFGKQTFQDNNQKTNDLNTNNSNLTCGSSNSECQPNENSVNLDHIGQINNPPLLLRKTPSQSAQTQPSAANLVQQIKQTIAPMNIQTMHGGVIYTRQIPVNIGGGQTINLITVPSTELIDEANQKHKGDIKFINQHELDSPIIKIVPQSQNTPSTECTTEESTNHIGLTGESAQNAPNQHQPVLTQMRIKLPMLSKTHQMVSGARVVRPSFFQIQRNVIGGANQHVYQQLVLTAAPPLGQHTTIRLPQNQACRQIRIADGQSTSEPQISSSTLEQLREFDMVLEQVKERSTVQPNANPNNNFSKLIKPSSDTTDSISVTSTVTESTQQVLYSIASNQSLNVAYVNRKSIAATPTTSTFIRSPDSSGITESSNSTHVQVPQTVTNESTSNEVAVQPNQSKPAKVGSKSKSRSKSSSNTPNSLKINTVTPKTSTQKPLEDEQTTQRILYILAEYKEQVENSPDKDKPAPRRRSNPPTNPPGSSKRKKSSSGSRRSGARDMSPVHGEDTCRTMGSEDSSCGTSQGDCNESCLESHSPQDSPRKVVRKMSFENEATTVTQPRPQPQRNVIVADGQTITVARGTTGKPATAVLMPANYILPVSMMKGGQQIAIVTNRGPKLLTVGGGEGGTTNALLLQRLIGPAGLKPVLTRPGVRHIRLPTAALHNLHTFNLTTATNVQPPDSTASPASAPTPPDLVEMRANSSPWPDRECRDVKPERESSPEGSEPWNLPSSADRHDYTYEDRGRSENMDRTVLEALPDRYSPDMEAQRIFDKMFDVDSKKSYTVDSHDDTSRCAYDIDASDCDDKVYHQVVHKKDGSSQRHHRLTHVSAAALRHKYAILEHELRLQKSLSEECEDLGVDSPSASELFPEAELLFSSSPAHEATQHSHTPQPTIINQSGIPQPDIDDQIATDGLIQRDVQDNQQELDVRTLGLDEGIVTVSEDGLQATIALDQEEFARSHPNTTFHSEPTEEGEVQPFAIAGLKGRHITSTIFHAGRAPATVLVTTPQTSVISQATTDNIIHNNLKYANMDQIINSSQGTHRNLNLSSVLVKDDRLTKFDNILTDSRELHLSNTASAIVHATGNATQVIRRVCYDDDKRDARFLMDEPEGLIAGDDAKMVAEDSRDANFESIAGDVDDDNSSTERHAELFWESNSASERSESRRPLDFSSDSDKCCKSPSYDTNSTDSSGVGTHLRLDSVIKDARGIDRSGSGDGSSADDTHPPLRTYPAKRTYHPLGEMERSISGKTRAGERSPDITEVRRRASGRGVVKRGCHCCTGSPAPPRPKKSRQRKPNMDFN